MRYAALALLPLFAAAAAPPGPDARFRTLADTEYAWRKDSLAQPAGEGADRIMAARLPDVSPAAQDARLARWQATLAALDAIPQASLSPPEQANYAVYRNQIAALAAAQRFREWQQPANSDTAFWDPSEIVGDQPLRSAREYDNAVARIRAIPAWFAQQTANMRAGEARGFTPPRVTLQGRDGTIRAVAAAKRAEDSALWKPFETIPANVPPARADAIRAQARDAIMGAAKPAYAALLAFWNDDYVPMRARRSPRRRSPTAPPITVRRSRSSPRLT